MQTNRLKIIQGKIQMRKGICMQQKIVIIWSNNQLNHADIDFSGNGKILRRQNAYHAGVLLPSFGSSPK